MLGAIDHTPRGGGVEPIRPDRIADPVPRPLDPAKPAARDVRANVVAVIAMNEEMVGALLDVFA